MDLGAESFCCTGGLQDILGEHPLALGDTLKLMFPSTHGGGVEDDLRVIAVISGDHLPWESGQRWGGWWLSHHGDLLGLEQEPGGRERGQHKNQFFSQLTPTFLPSTPPKLYTLSESPGFASRRLESPLYWPGLFWWCCAECWWNLVHPNLKVPLEIWWLLCGWLLCDPQVSLSSLPFSATRERTVSFYCLVLYTEVSWIPGILPHKKQ